MKRHVPTALFALLLLACPVWCQTIKLPKEATGEPGSFVKVPADTDGKEVRWYSPDKGLQVFPVELLKDSKTAVVIANAPGRYRLIAWTAKGDVPSDPAVCVVIVGEAPDPGPGPVPPVPPVPPTPSEGRWLYIVYETMDTLPSGQSNILTSAKARTYLRDKLKKTGGLPDGEFVIWDKDTDAAGYPKEWQERHAKYRGKGSSPYLVISNGKALWEGPLPKDVDAFMELLKKQLETAKPVAPEGGH